MPYDSRMRSWEADLAARQARTRDEAIERTRRGAALVRAALAGEPAPVAVEPPAETTATPVGPLWVACPTCYTPVWGRPGDHCPDHQPTEETTQP